MYTEKIREMYTAKNPRNVHRKSRAMYTEKIREMYMEKIREMYTQKIRETYTQKIREMYTTKKNVFTNGVVDDLNEIPLEVTKVKTVISFKNGYALHRARLVEST